MKYFEVPSELIHQMMESSEDLTQLTSVLDRLRHALLYLIGSSKVKKFFIGV